MKIVFISDTHSSHWLFTIPECDILIHSGDCMNSGYYEQELIDFNNWIQKQPAKHKIIVPGNHDRLAENNTKRFKELLPNIHVLIEEYIEIEGLKIFGTPYQPEFNNWAFNLPMGSKKLISKWKRIPKHLDILITHCPPFGILDYYKEQQLGDPNLLDRVKTVLPKYHVFGHIHLDNHVQIHKEFNITFINASVLNNHYHVFNQPVIIDIP